MTQDLSQTGLGVGNRVERGRLVQVLETGELLVDVERDRPQRILCDFLQSFDAPGMTLDEGDVVLVLAPKTLDERGCVLGKVGRYRRPEQPKEVVIEAKQNLTLKCGESSITLRKDGKLLVKGVDVVSRAKRTNKIKGGSVHIN